MLSLLFPSSQDAYLHLLNLLASRFVRSKRRSHDPSLGPLEVTDATSLEISREVDDIMRRCVVYSPQLDEELGLTGFSGD